jgi:hypothetical protein
LEELGVDGRMKLKLIKEGKKQSKEKREKKILRVKYKIREATTERGKKTTKECA